MTVDSNPRAASLHRPESCEDLVALPIGSPASETAPKRKTARSEANSLNNMLASRTAAILDACTTCGRCFEVCPMTAPAGIDSADPKAVTRDVLNLLRGDEGSTEAREWVRVCSGSGTCIPNCAYDVNPRLMLSMARLKLQRQKDETALRAAGKAAFSTMTRGVRILSRLQLAPELLARFGLEAMPEAGSEPPEIVFYTGCNVLRTPHIALLALDVLDALKVRYRVMGGASYCCGIFQFRAGDSATAGQLARHAGERFASVGAAQIVAWCPTCMVQLREIDLPGFYSGNRAEMTPFVRFLSSRLGELKRFFIHPVRKRVGLHEHPGIEGVTEGVIEILKAIPGIEFVELEQPRVGWMCNSVTAIPEFRRSLHRNQLELAERAKVTTLAGIYHVCHRELCSHERDWPFEVVNFMELIGETMGFKREDTFKRLKIMQDVDAIIADTRDLIDRHGLDLEEVRNVILKDLLAEQPLPLGRGTEA